MGSIADICFNKVMPKSDKHLPKGVSRDEYAALARKFINECGEDPDMLDAIEFNASCFLVRGDSKLRTPEEIVNRVAAYRSTLHEMLAIGESNPPMRAVMKKLSTSFSGLALPKGMIAKVIEKAEAVDLTPFENLDKTSNSLAIHNAVMVLNKAVNNITKETGAKDKLDGPDEHKPFCMFVECAILTRLPKASLRGISAALSTPIAAKLSDFYDAFSSGRNNLSEKSNLSKGVQVEIKHELNLLNGVIHELKENAERALGHETFTSINLEDAQTVSDDDLDAGSILANVRDESKLILAEKREAFLADVVKGKGKAAEKMRGLFADMIGPAPFDPADVAFNKITKNASKMTNRNIMRIAKMVMEGDLKDTILFKDVNRRMEVTIEGVGTLSTDFNKALDQIACFVTGKEDAKFKTLDDASKRKAAIVIGFLGQESDKAVVDGCAYALDPKGDTAAIVFGGRQDNDKKMYNLRLGKDGHL